MAHPPSPAIDIIVPVYNAVDDLKRCVDSILLCTNGDYRLLLIDDASPDPAIGAYFEEIRSRGLPQVDCVSNENNIGFTLTANRGMSSARAGADVVLLNSDTIVTRGWLDKLVRCAQSDPCIGTITPFSNNAEICSLPRFCENNPWPPERDAEPMVRALELAAAPSYPELPTGVGFCLYIRRTLIDSIGSFDPVFGLGYGEENDFCMRAAGAGFRNVLCDDAFVVHLGGSSFGAKRSDLARRNMAILLEHHPDYLDLVGAYIAADPLRPLRELALTHYRRLINPLPGLLHVIHGHGGGTEYHVRALIASSSSAFHHYLLIAIGDEWQLEEHAEGEIRSYDFQRLIHERWGEFLSELCARFGIELIHLHNISGCRDGLISALAETELPYGYTVHDLNFACPTITFLNAEQNYCGAVTDATVCAACLGAQPDFAAIDIESWRARHRSLLERAAFVIAPSSWAAGILRRYFPEHEVRVIPHGSTNGLARADAIHTPLPFCDDGRPVVAVLGAIGPDKGARRLENLVELTRQRGLGLRWVLIGYLDRGRDPWHSSDGVFTMHGPYASDALPSLLDHYRVRLVVYPSVGPETFSFTLSEAWAAGRPAVVPPIGALVDRVSATGAGWVLTEKEWRSDERMLDRIVSLLDPMERNAYDRAAAHARAAPQPTLAAMTDATLAVYRDAQKRASPQPPAKPIAAERCLAALHYAPWRPPSTTVAAPDVVAPPAPRGPMAGIARTALRIRHTLPGRMLYRLAPKALREALKARISG
ncbi:MAG: glycosyltransferase [Betaproteobacteria bacterium]|nr:MAG: glycosyltransferase [Betaproteobacteria bacterium]